MCLQGQLTQRRGAAVAIGKLAEHFGDNLFATLPNIWTAVIQPLEELPEHCESGMTVLSMKYCLYEIVFTKGCPNK